MKTEDSSQSGGEITLADCPIGLFWCGKTLALKTEYGNNDGRINAYIVSSGEYFWGYPPQTTASQRAQMVRPIDTDKVLAALTASGQGGGERAKVCLCMEIAGEDPNCIRHGRGTMWAKEHPDICELAECLATPPATDPAGREAEQRQGGDVEAMRKLITDFCHAAEYTAGCDSDDGVDADFATSEIMSSMGSPMAVVYEKARALPQPVASSTGERERIARVLCTQHGGDPDALATEEHDCWEGPLWTVFASDADAILATRPDETARRAALEEALRQCELVAKQQMNDCHRAAHSELIADEARRGWASSAGNCGVVYRKIKDIRIRLTALETHPTAEREG